MKPYPSKKAIRGGLPVIELLVVVSIIALLLGILRPAIGRAREQAQLTRSQANLKQLGTACATYAAEWKDRQLTYVNDNLSRYGQDPAGAMNGFQQQTGYNHPYMIFGYAQGVVWVAGQTAGAYRYVPISWPEKFGAFRIPNARQFSQYLNGRFY